MWDTGRLNFWIAIPVLVIGLLISFSIKADINWLLSNQNADGSIAQATDIATPYQSTSEVLRTVNVLASTTDTNTALQYVASDSYHSTENLSRKIIALNNVSQETAPLVTELLGMQNIDGGWGELHGYNSSVIDTAFGLSVLSELNLTASVQIQSAVIYLLNQQQSDGGWHSGVNTSSVYETSLVINALSYYKKQYSGVAESIVSATNYLLVQQNTSGLWASSFESVHALLALTQSISDISILKSSITTLEQNMLANTSWDNDVYITALVLRLLDTYQKRIINPVATITNGGVVGEVVLAGSDEPISDVNITVKEQSGLTVTTNSLGVFNIQSIAEGTYTIIFEKAGFSSASNVVNVSNGKLINIGKVALNILPTTGVLRGAVFDSESQAPITNAQLNLTGPQSLVINVDQSGAFNLTNLMPGSYSLGISADGYNSVTATFDISAGQNLSLKQGLTKQGAFLDNTPANLYGFVVDGKSGQNISGATISLDSGPSIATDTAGKFVFTSLPRGSYRAVVSAQNYQTSTYIINFADGSNGNVGNLSLYPENIAVQAPTALTLMGTVIDGIGNSPIVGASVKLINTGEIITSDQSGKFTLSNISLKQFDIEISAAGFQTKTYGITVSSFGEVAVEFVLPPFVAPDPSVTTSIISGTITDKDSGLPVVGADISIDGTSAATTNVQGQYTISGISLLEFNLAISVMNYSPAALNVKLSAHGSYTVNQTLVPVVNEVIDPVTNLPTKLFQVLSVKPVSENVTANTKARFTAEIANLADVEQEGLIIAEIIDAAGINVATILSNIPGTTEQQANVLFAATETKTFEFDWDVKQAPVGKYQVIVRAVKPGSINRGNPTGTIFAESGSYVNVLLTKLVGGATKFDPPLSQAGTTIPIKLEALIVNNGNAELTNSDFTLSIIEPDTNNIIHTAQATLDALKVLNNKTLSFGEWLPSIAGNLLVTVIPNDSAISGIVNGAIYIGDKATGTFSIDKEFLPEGSHTIRAKIKLQGVDTKTGSGTDPLFFAVKNAVEKGGSYVGPNAVSWHQRNRCLGCHIQTQSYSGLASSLDKANISKADTDFLFSTLVTSQQSNGGIYLSHPGFAKTQTSLALWALKSTPSKEDAFLTMYHATRFMFDRKIRSGDETYFTQDHNTGYVNNASNITALVTMGMSDVIATSRALDLSQVGFNPSLLPSYELELSRMVRFFLNRYTDNTSENTVHALRMSALAEAKLAITDPLLLQEIETAISYEENLLRSRQRSDGGWGRYTSWSSDPLVSAMVGIALDYTNPSADDPMVRKNIQYLLNSQLSDGSWNNNNGYFGTRLASTSFVMAYMPKALDRLGGIDVDLTVDVPANISLENPTTTETTITPISDGNQHFWSLTGVTSNEQVIEFDMTLHDLLLNEQRPVASTAFMEFNNSFNDDRMRVDLDVPSVTATSELTLAVTANKLTYTANEDVVITPIVGNTSPVTDAAVVDISIRAVGATDVIATLLPIETGSLASGASVTLSALWNTNGQYVGAYEIYTKLLDTQGRVVKETTTPFSILSAGIAINSSISTDKPIYQSWDNVTLNGRIRNISANVIQPNTFIELIVKDPAGTTLYFDTFKEGELLPATLRDITSSLVLNDAVSGDYAVEFTVKDNFTRNILTTSATQFQVQRNILHSLVGTMSTKPSRVYQGDPTICEDTLTNRSSTGLSDVTITRQMLSVATGEVISELTNLQAVAAGASGSNLQSFKTENMELGGYLCVLSASINGNTQKLAAAGFEVLEPPIKIATTLNQIGKGRLLILLDGEKEHDEDKDHHRDQYDHNENKNHDDSHGPKGAPSLAEQRLFLEAQLKAAGWSYTIVTDDNDFAVQMRSNGYVAYALFNEHKKLDKQVQQELRERIYSGEGLFVAGNHDERNHYLNAALGIKHKGKYSKVSSFIFKPSPLALNGEQVLTYKDKPLRTELKGAEVVAEFNLVAEQHENNDHKDEDNNKSDSKDDDEHGAHKYSKAAVTSYQFGMGKSVYVAFDLLAHATAAQDPGLLDDLLNAGLLYTHPTNLNMIPTNVLPVRVSLTNEGIATPGQVVITLPEGVQIVDSMAGTHLNAQGQLVVPFTLDEEQTFSSRFYVRLPAVSGSFTFKASIQTGIEPEFEEYDVVNLIISRPLYSGLNEALVALTEVSSEHKYYKKTLDKLNSAQKNIINNKIEYVLKDLIKATDYLAKVTHDKVKEIRVMVDHSITHYAALLPLKDDESDD